MQKIVKVSQLQVIDEVVKVLRSVQRQVPMIQEMQQDQKPEEAQMSFKMYVDRGSECKEGCRKTKRQSTSVKPGAKRLERRGGRKRLTMNSRERQSMKWCQTCGKHECEREREGSTRHVDRSILAHMSESRRAR